jgi:hypothetical protein
MKQLALVMGLLVATCSYAGGFVDEPTCYSWNGGHKSAGSFSKCQPELQAWVKPPAPPPVAVPAVVTAPPVVHASPIMMPQSHPPAKPIVKKKKPKQKPKPKCICEPLPPK